MTDAVLSLPTAGRFWDLEFVFCYFGVFKRLFHKVTRGFIKLNRKGRKVYVKSAMKASYFECTTYHRFSTEHFTNKKANSFKPLAFKILLIY